MFPKMFGKYFYIDYCSGIFRAVYKDDDFWVNRYVSTGDAEFYSTFGQDMNGELFIDHVLNGEIMQVVDSSALRIAVPGNKSSFNNNGVKVFPNPNKGLFTLQVDALLKELYMISVTNQQTQNVITEYEPTDVGINE